MCRPPVWLDEQGNRRPVRPCPRCGGDVPVTRYAPTTLRQLGWRPYDVVSTVNWCGHGQECILVPESAEWIGEVPVLGEAR